MKIFYLYLKEVPSGLKYLGITTQNPYKYYGSGIFWRRHLKKYKYGIKKIKTEKYIIILANFANNLCGLCG